MRNPFKRKKEQRSIENPRIPISSDSVSQYLGWSDSITPAKVSVSSALGVPAVWGAVDFMSGTIASLPLNLYRKDADGQRSKASDDPLHYLLHDSPNGEWTSFDWRKYSWWQTFTTGRSLSWIDKAPNGRIVGLWPMEPSKVEVIKRGTRKVYIFQEDSGRRLEYQADEIIDICWAVEPDQITAISPILKNKGAIGLAIALQEYASKLFLNGGVPPMSLEGPFNSPAGVANAARDMQGAIKEAADQGRQVLPIPLNHQLKALGFNPEQGQLVDARLFSIQEIARVFSLPPVFLQDLSKGTYANTEQQDLQLVKHTIGRWVNRMEQELNLKLFRGNRTRFVEHNVDGLLRGDFKTRMEGMSKAIQNSLMTPNEGRALDNRAPKEGGDDLVIQQNMTRVGVLGVDDDGS